MAEEIEVILAKYSTQESSINERLIKKKEEKIQKHSEFKKERREKREKNMEIATLRNKEIIQPFRNGFHRHLSAIQRIAVITGFYMAL
nr:uncharacterized protein LOC111426761 isoform X2 [Onthophagus taurus]